jgi:microcystin-dependent protein
MEGTIGEIRMFAGNFPPLFWAFCQGQLLSIAQNTALFSVVGTMYGGDGQVTFALPDLRGRIARGTGQGAGLGVVDIGQVAGFPTTTLTNANLPIHTHLATAVLNARSDPGDSLTPVGALPAQSGAGDPGHHGGATDTQMATGALTVSLQPSGSSEPIEQLPPYLGVNYIICLEGIYPSRN